MAKALKTAATVVGIVATAVALAPLLGPGAAAVAGLGLELADLSNPARFDIDSDSARLIEAQRRRPWGAWPKEDPEFAVAHRIGGWVDQAEVTPAGVAVRRIMEWPQDRLGERITA